MRARTWRGGGAKYLLPNGGVAKYGRDGGVSAAMAGKVGRPCMSARAVQSVQRSGEGRPSTPFPA